MTSQPSFNSTRATSVANLDDTRDENLDQSSEDNHGGRATSRFSVKNRKTTYYSRKDELESLKIDYEALSKRAKRLREVQKRREQPLRDALETKTALKTRIARNGLFIAGAQSLVASYRNQFGGPDPPIGRHIHLPLAPAARSRLITDMKPHMIQQALDFLLARCHYSDLRYATRQLENSVTSQGDHIGMHWEIVHLDVGSLSLHEVHREIVGYLHTQEMAIADQVGVVRVHEGDVSEFEHGATHTRVLSRFRDEISVEKNIIEVERYFPRSDVLERPHSVFVVDYVDVDDSFPHQPDKRIRCDIASARLLLQCDSPEHGKSSLVTLLNWGFIKVHTSPLASCDELEAMARDGLSLYFDTLLKKIREWLAWRQR